MDINFGSGTLIGRRTDISNPTPAFMGILQDVQVDIDVTLKELIGQYKFPVDVAAAQTKITFKAKFARIQANIANSLVFGQTQTAADGENMITAETASVPAPSGPYTVTVAQAATFVDDLGVFYATTGVQLTRVASGPTVGQYAVNESTGVYTFAAADASVSMLFYYSFGVTTLQQITVDNQFMGQSPSFELNLKQQYTNNAGVANVFFLKLYACKSSKLALPFKNTDYTIQELDGQAYANLAGQVLLWATTE